MRSKKVKVEKISLRKMKWHELITYFMTLPQKESFDSKDLVDYFQYKKIEEMKVEHWSPPDYLRQKSMAKKILGLYGRDLSVNLIDILFSRYEEITNKKFGEIGWSLGLISSEKTGWLFEKLMAEYRRRKSEEVEYKYQRLLKKPREDWTVKDFDDYENLIKEKNNGKA